jgi:hypothetical protein
MKVSFEIRRCFCTNIQSKRTKVTSGQKGIVIPLIIFVPVIIGLIFYSLESSHVNG